MFVCKSLTLGIRASAEKHPKVKLKRKTMFSLKTFQEFVVYAHLLYKPQRFIRISALE